MKLPVKLILAVLILCGLSSFLSAQERRPVDSQHPLWMIHVDVWNSADPQKIIDLVPDDIKPYVCMNLSLSCQYDKETDMYRMPRCAVRTYKSWALVCQHNNMWFTCQPASGGHTHIQDDDLETFEYFFKTYPNFLGWNYAEQFWGFDEGGDESSSSQSSRLALFAKLVPMHHKYGGFLTISFCGSVYSHALNPLGMMKRNADLMQACKDYPDAILWLYKYTHPVCFYNNESVTFGPFISGLAKNYGVRYDNCGWNDGLNSVLGENHGKSYPGSAGIGTVMEQTCVNGGAVWDGPELIWTEDFKNLSNTTVDGYNRRNWGCFDNFKGIWLDMFRKIIDGTMYIPTREEVINKTKIVVVNNVNSGSAENMYATWANLYDGLYKQDDPFNYSKDGNYGTGQWQNNLCYFKKSGRYGAIPMVTGLYDDLAKSIPVQVNKSNYTSRWSTVAKKTADFNAQYPEVSKGDLYVNRYRNQLVTYTPYTYLNKKKSASASIPLQYNTCDTLKLVYGKLSSGIVREFADHIDFYLNNYRSDTTTSQTDQITVVGVSEKPTYSLVRHTTGAMGYYVTVTDEYDEEKKSYTLNVKHMGPVDISLNCSGTTEHEEVASLPKEQLPTPKQPEAFAGPVVIEAENMDTKEVSSVALTHSGWWATDMEQFAGMGYVVLGTSTNAALRHQIRMAAAGDYMLTLRYCGATKAGNIRATVNGASKNIAVKKGSKNFWRKASVKISLKAGLNTIVLSNPSGINMYLDQIIYMPVDNAVEKYKVTVRDVANGRIVADADSAAEGDTVRLTILPDEGFALKELRVVNSVYYTQGKTITFEEGATEVAFVMPDENYTIKATFADVSSLMKIDFGNVLGGNIPAGWRTTDGTDVHEYPNTYGSGSRTMTGFTGYDGKGLYWRNTNAEYGRQTAYPLVLEPGRYKLTFAMAAWKGTPTYKARILSSSGTQIATTGTYTAAPNADGHDYANLSSAVERTLTFNVTTEGKYIISFIDAGSGYDEYLLLACRLQQLPDQTDISIAHADDEAEDAIYDVQGMKRSSLQHGMNVVRTSGGVVKKILMK